MTGHRRKKGKPNRPQARINYWTARLHEAPSAEAQFATAADWYRAAAARCASPATVLHEGSVVLAARARQVEAGEA